MVSEVCMQANEFFSCLLWARKLFTNINWARLKNERQMLCRDMVLFPTGSEASQIIRRLSVFIETIPLFSLHLCAGNARRSLDFVQHVSCLQTNTLYGPWHSVADSIHSFSSLRSVFTPFNDWQCYTARIHRKSKWMSELVIVVPEARVLCVKRSVYAECMQMNSFMVKPSASWHCVSFGPS